jgi:hypothetical protein
LIPANVFDPELPGLYKRSEELCEPIGRLESLIERSPIKSREDVEIKLALYEADPDCADDVASWVRDLQILLSDPSILTA